MAQDPRGVLYLATGSGVVEYDGVSTPRSLPLENGSIARSLAAHPSGRVFVGGIGEIGVIRRDAEGRSFYTPLPGSGSADSVDPALEGLRDVWRLWPTEEGFLAWTLDRILDWDGQTLRSWPLDRRTMPGRIFDKLVVTDPEGEIQVLDGGVLRPAGRIELDGERLRMWIQNPAGESLVGTAQGHLWRLSAEAGRRLLAEETVVLRPTRLPSEADSLLEEFRLYQGTYLRDGGVALSTMSGGAVVIEADGRLRYRLDRAVGLPDNAVWTVAEDHDGGLWLGLSKGLARAALDIPFTVYGETMGLGGRVQAVARARERLWAATTLGLFRLEKDGFERVDEVPGPCWSLWVSSLDDREELLVGASDGVYVLREESFQRVLASRHAFSLFPSALQPNLVWVGGEEGLGAVARSGSETWEAVGSILDVGAQVRSITEGSDGSLWLGTLVNGVLYLPRPDLRSSVRAPPVPLGIEAGLESLNSVKVFTHGDRIYGATGAGLVTWNPSAERFEPDSLFGPDPGGLARVARAPDGSFWLSRDGEFPLWIDPKTGRSASRIFRYLPTPDVYTYLPGASGNAFLGTPKGLFHFHGRLDDRAVAAPPHRRLLLREVAVDGELRPLEPTLDLASTGRRIRFSWAAPVFDEPVEDRYRFRMAGLDEEWSSWTSRTETEYMNLPGGRYAFEVEARDLTGEVFDEVRFELRAPPPWYLTWPALIGWVLTTGLLIWGGTWIRSVQDRREKDRLRKEVTARTYDLQTARDEAHAATLAKSRFLANMSHEIRTPMNGVIGMTEILKGTELGDDQREYVDIIQTSGESLLSLINDILDVSKIEAGELELVLAELDPRRILGRVVALLEPLAEEKSIGLSVAVDERLPKLLRGDPDRLQQVLVNLMGNGIKFTDHGGVTVSADLMSADPSWITIRFTVADTGIGIPHDKMERLFKPFSQIDPSRTRKYGGTGLGLTISKQLVELMDGEIGVDSTAGEGSTFWFTARLGRVARPSRERSAERAGTPRLSTPEVRVLVVEDNPINQMIAEAVLEKGGYRVTVAGGGRQALDLFKRQTFDVVLMDIEMPEMDGLETMAHLRALGEKGQDVPIVALTAHAMKGDRETFLEAGIDGYVAKPFRPEELYEAIDRLVGSIPAAGRSSGG